MADEPRRSGRATKGQHKHTSSSPAPNPKPPGPATKAATAKSKPTKKPQDPEPEDDDDETIRCICGDDNPKDKRAFIGCEACQVWQHNVCMGLPDDEDEIPDHYFCEECAPTEHQEAINAMNRGEKIWLVRNKIFQNEKKMSKSRKQRTKTGEEYRPGWLKKDVLPEAATDPTPTPPAETPAPSATHCQQETVSKRKREVKEDPEAQEVLEENAERPSRQDKRRRSSAAPSNAAAPSAAPSPDTDTALVAIEQLPQDRKKVASSLAGVIETDLQKRVDSGLNLADGQTPKSTAVHHAVRIEYALHVNYGAGQSEYAAQFRNLLPNLKRNALLIQRLLDGSLSADELANMSTSDMASEELQRERAKIKEVLDRQAVAIQEEGPRYAQDHKGYHLIESESASDEHVSKEAAASTVQAPLPSASPTQPVPPPLSVDTHKDGDRRPSSRHFDMNNIWAKTAQSPTGQTPPVIGRPLQGAPRRLSSVHPSQPQPINGAKDDPDIDRMLEDDNDDYAPPDVAGADAIIWRGKLVQSSEDEGPTVNARFVAGRDLTSTVSWHSLLPQRLSIDGRLVIQKAEDYVSGLRWSTSSDVAVLSLSPYDNAEAFNNVFEYFHSRERYAVVEKDKPPMVKDLYIIPVEKGGELPPHLDMLEYCSIKKPVEERLLLATLIVARAPESPPKVDNAAPSHQAAGANGHLPQHVRQSIGGPQGSPITSQTPFSPATNAPPSGYGAPAVFPPNPYGPQPPAYPTPLQQKPVDARFGQILGDLQYTTTAQVILQSSEGGLTDEQLHSLKAILQEDVNARTDLQALSRRLNAKP